MAESAIAGLFQTPEMYQQAQLQRQQQEAANYAQLEPLQRAAYGTYMAGQQLGAGVGQLLGAQDPQLQMITQQQQILSRIDQNDPESIAKGAQMAAQMGNNNLAAALAMRAREAGAALAQIQQRTEEKKTPEQRNAEAMNILQQKIEQATAFPEGTPGRAEALQSLTGQLANLRSLTAKAPPAQVKEIALAEEIALLSGPKGSPTYNTAYATALQDQIKSREAKLPSMVEEYNFALTPAGGGYRGTYLEFVNSRAAAGRPPGAAPAPGALTTITDPTNPKQTIVVQSGAYRGGGIGSPGVIGIAKDLSVAKPLPAYLAKDEEKDFEIATAATNLASDANNFIGRIKSGEIKFGLKDKASIRARQVFGSSDPDVIAREDYDKFLKVLTNESLRLNKGTQTEGDAIRAAKELESSESPEAAASAMRRLVEINVRRVQNASDDVLRRRKNANFPEPEQKIDVPKFDVHIINNTEYSKFLNNPKYPSGTTFIDPEGIRRTKP